MKNEPVAWMYYDDWNNLRLGQTMPPDINWFPVYTHPVKELTDEEMLECAEGVGCVFDYSYKGEVTFISKNALKRFVLAILRKAQEK